MLTDWHQTAKVATSDHLTAKKISHVKWRLNGNSVYVVLFLLPWSGQTGLLRFKLSQAKKNDSIPADKISDWCLYKLSPYLQVNNLLFLNLTS